MANNKPTPKQRPEPVETTDQGINEQHPGKSFKDELEGKDEHESITGPNGEHYGGDADKAPRDPFQPPTPTPTPSASPSATPGGGGSDKFENSRLSQAPR